MATITVKANFGDGGKGLTSKGQGKVTLATILRGIAADLARMAADGTRFVEETVPVSSDVGLLYYPAEIIEYVDVSGANKTPVASAETPDAGEYTCDKDDRRTITFAAADAVASAVVGYLRRISSAPLVESAAETFVLSDAETLLVSVDGGAVQTALFETADFGDIGAATAAEVAAVINADVTGATAEVRGTKVVLRSDTEGPGGSIQVTGGTANDELAFSTTEVVGAGVSVVAG